MKASSRFAMLIISFFVPFLFIEHLLVLKTAHTHPAILKSTLTHFHRSTCMVALIQIIKCIWIESRCSVSIVLFVCLISNAPPLYFHKWFVCKPKCSVNCIKQKKCAHESVETEKSVRASNQSVSEIDINRYRETVEI